MSAADPSAFHGIYASTVCPMTPSFAVDSAALAAHVATVAATPGIRGILCNGHAGENFALNRDERRLVVQVAREAAGRAAAIVAGINCEDSLDAAAQAKDAAAAGADVIMIFAPYSWSVCQDEASVIAHHRTICAATDLPVMLFQASVGSGRLAYPPATLAALVRLPNVVAIKEGSWETLAYENNRRLVRSVAPHVAVMASGDEHLFTSFVLGSEGSLVSLAAVLPEEIVALDQAVRRGDLAEARRLHEVLYPFARAIYGAAPSSFANARLKTCLKLLGRLACDATRPPIGPLGASEIEALRRVIRDAGLPERG